MALWGRDANEIERARISMMARGSKAPSIGRIQKRKTNFSKSSLSACNARPVHTKGRVEDGRGNLGHSATPRFPSPLIEPDVPISGIRLSDWFSSHGTQRCVEWSAFEAQEPAFPIDHITGEAFGPAPCHFVPSGKEIAHALIDVSVNTTEC